MSKESEKIEFDLFDGELSDNSDSHNNYYDCHPIPKRCQCYEINKANIEKFNNTGTFAERFKALNDPKGVRPPPPVSCNKCNTPCLPA